MVTMNEIEVIKTSDFTLAATLLCMGHDVDGIDKENMKRVIFYFKKTPTIDANVAKYFRNELLVNPLDFARAQREIRAQIHTDL